MELFIYLFIFNELLQITMSCKTPTFMYLDTYGCLRWWNFSFFSKNQSLVVLTPCVGLNCLSKHLVLWPKYNQSTI